MALAKANNHLAINLHHILAGEKGNVFFSPFSISAAMAMLLSAAEGETESQLRAGLGHVHADLQKESVASVFEQYLSSLLKEQDAYSLSCANSMLSQQGFQVKEKYKSILADCFKALMMEVDFRRESAKVVNQINEWVSEKTNKMIPSLVDSLDPATVIVLLNAVYFKGSWLNKFEEKVTYPEKFYNEGVEENAKDIDMMHMNGTKFYYTDNELFQALQLPYVGEEVAMLILLPRARDGLSVVESSFTPSFIEDLKQNMVEKKVKVTLPKFRLEYSKSLVPSFKVLGIERVFQRGAELGIASDSSDLMVSEILHKAVLVVNEEGSEAAAATIVCMKRSCPAPRFRDPVFVADHPFAFVIYDTRNDLILFMGRVEEL